MRSDSGAIQVIQHIFTPPEQFLEATNDYVNLLDGTAFNAVKYVENVERQYQQNLERKIIGDDYDIDMKEQ